MGRSGWWWTGGLVLGMLLGGCSARQATPLSSQTAGALSEPSTLTVDSVQLQVQDRLPARILVVVQGTFPDTCTQIDQINIGEVQPGNVIPVTLSANRPVDVACASTVTAFEEHFQLPVENLPAGTYTVDVAGHTATIELSVENLSVEGYNGESASDLAIDECPDSAGDLIPYFAFEMGLCFLFPDGYEAQEPGQVSRTVLVTGPAVEGEGPEPVAPTLIISVWDEDVNEPIESFVSDLIAEAMQEVDVDQSQTTIGGYPAEVVTGLPGRAGSRQAWVNVEGLVLHFILLPVDPAYPTATQEAEKLWQTVLPSVAFFPPDLMPFRDVWETYDLPEFGVRMAAPSEWTLFRGEGFAALGEPGGNPNMVTIGIFNDLPVEVTALSAALLVRYQNQGEVGASLSSTTMNGAEVVRVSGLQSLCVDFFVPVPEAGVVRQISIHNDACPDGAPSDIVIDILDSLEFTEP